MLGGSHCRQNPQILPFIMVRRYSSYGFAFVVNAKSMWIAQRLEWIFSK